MSQYLLCRLYGPMAAWGEPAVGEDRLSAPMPSHSALLGLCAAALGIARHQEAELSALNEQLAFAVAQRLASGQLDDFHTVQVASRNKKSPEYIRKHLLERNKPTTIISKRTYVNEGYWLVLITADSARLTQLEQALRTPFYPLFLGRRSCPLAAPLRPTILTAEHPKAAFFAYQHHLETIVETTDATQPSLESRLRLSAETVFTWSAEWCALDAFGLDAVEQRQAIQLRRNNQRFYPQDVENAAQPTRLFNEQKLWQWTHSPQNNEDLMTERGTA